MPLNVILVIALLACFAACVNGYLGAGFLIFMYIVLEGMIRQTVPLPSGPPAQITENTWAPNLLLPVIVFLILWQWRFRGRIGPQTTLMDLVRAATRRRSPALG
jgi:hypothetical protein